METLKGLIKFLILAVFKIAVFFIIFMLCAWALLGMTPSETWTTTVSRISSLTGGIVNFGHDTMDTAGRMKGVAQYHLNQAAERIDGKDPYEDYNKALDQKVQQDMGVR